MSEKPESTLYINNLLESYNAKRKLVDQIKKMTINEIHDEVEKTALLIAEEINHIEKQDKERAEDLEFLLTKLNEIITSIVVFNKKESKVKKMFLDLKIGNIN